MTSTSTQHQELNIQSIQWNSLTWVDIARPSIAEMQWLKERYSFHPLDLDDCLSSEVIRILTIIGTIMLPMTVVSSLYGMNVWLPFGSSTFAFGGVLAVLALIAVVMLIFFRVRRWI